MGVLREVQRLSQDEGVNLAGIKRIIELRQEVDGLREQVADLEAQVAQARDAADEREAEVHASYRRDLVPFNTGRQILIWRPDRRHRAHLNRDDEPPMRS